jgi:hypothetical protein
MHVTYELNAPNWDSNPLAAVFFGRYLFYFLFGIFLSSYDISKIRASHALALSGAFFACMAYLFFIRNMQYEVFIYPVFVSLFIYAIYKQTRGNAIAAMAYGMLGEVGKYSLAIYIVHSQALSALNGLIFSPLGVTLGIVYADSAIRLIVLVSAAAIASYYLSRALMGLYAKAFGKFLNY